MHKVLAKGILSPQNGINVYRGCTHGCIYCDSRSKCYRMDHDFEDIAVKINAPELLEKALRGKRRKCMIATGAMSDPYMPLEKEMGLTRQCLEIIARHGFGAAVQTKSDLILRDIDLLDRINRHTKCVVQITITTINDDLCRIIEPHVCPTSRRAEILHEMQRLKIPTICWMTPILPFINDTVGNVRGIVELCAEAGVKGIIDFGMGLTLREGNREYYYRKLDEYFPGLKSRYIRAYGNAYELPSLHSEQLMNVFRKECERYGIMHNPDDIFGWMHTFEDKSAGEQISMF